MPSLSLTLRLLLGLVRIGLVHVGLVRAGLVRVGLVRVGPGITVSGARRRHRVQRFYLQRGPSCWPGESERMEWVVM